MTLPKWRKFIKCPGSILLVCLQGRIGQLKDFIHKQEIDIVLLQEVTHTDFEMIRGYTAHLNIGRAILKRVQISLSNITRLPSG